MKKADELRQISESYEGPKMDLHDWIFYFYIILKAKHTARTTGKRSIKFGESSIFSSLPLSKKLEEEGFKVEQKYYAGGLYIKSISW